MQHPEVRACSRLPKRPLEIHRERQTRLRDVHLPARFCGCIHIWSILRSQIFYCSRNSGGNVSHTLACRSPPLPALAALIPLILLFTPSNRHFALNLGIESTLQIPPVAQLDACPV